MKKTTQGFTLVELLVVIGILGILMGSLFPAISSTMLKANTSTMAQKGRKIFVAITEANTEREGQQMASVWPKSAKDKDEDTEDIAGMDFSDSAKYFEELFDVKNYGTKDCQPYVKGLDLSILSGGGVPTAGGNVKSLEGKYVAWSVLKGLRDEMEEIIPVLVTRNCAVSTLPVSSDFDGKAKTEVGVGSDKGGEADTPFGNKAFVIVRKGGSAEVIDAKYSKLYQVYKNTPFSVPSDATLEYLKTGGK